MYSDYNVITHPCHEFNSGSSKPLLKFSNKMSIVENVPHSNNRKFVFQLNHHYSINWLRWSYSGFMHQETRLLLFQSMACSWWRHQMETFSALLAICAGNSPVPGELPTQRPVTRSFDVYFDLRPDKRLSKQLWGWWFETLSHSLWRHRNAECRGQAFNRTNARLRKLNHLEHTAVKC